MTEDVTAEVTEVPSTPSVDSGPPAFTRRVLIETFDDGGLTTGSRDIEVYLPTGYDQSTDRYPAIYLIDGRAVLSDNPEDVLYADVSYDKLIDEGLINPAIFVAIFNTHDGRLTDLPAVVQSGGPYDGRGGGLGGYYQFILTRLKPYIDDGYRTKPGPEFTGIAGFSLGGSAAFLMAYEHPETFGLAGCMSPSLWWGDNHALKVVHGDEGGKKPVRFWLDAGGGEYTMWVNVTHAYRLLEQKGWRAGDDLACYFDYPANHDWTPVRARSREMLHFLLRKEPLQLQEYRLVHAVNPAAPVMDLNSGHRRLVSAEAWYANGLRLTVPQPGFTIADTGVITLDADNPNLLHGAAPGDTAISSTYQGHTASLIVIGYHAAPAYLPCPPANSAPSVDGDVSDWPELPHEIAGSSGKAVARFGVSHDENHVHIAVHVLDDSIISDAATMPAEQDCITIKFDARPEAKLFRGEGYSFDDDPHVLAVSMSPGAPGAPISIASRGTRIEPGSEDCGRIMPEGSQVSCVIVPDGYRGILSLPASYLDEKQDGNWRVFRLNVSISNLDTVGEPVTETHWHPDWKTFHSVITAGIFARG